MSKTSRTGYLARWFAVLAIAGGAVVLTGCQTPVQAPGQQPISVPQHGLVDQRYLEEYAGRPADRAADELQRRIDDGLLPSSACLQHSLVEHPDGGYHLACAAVAPSP